MEFFHRGWGKGKNPYFYVFFFIIEKMPEKCHKTSKNVIKMSQRKKMFHTFGQKQGGGGKKKYGTIQYFYFENSSVTKKHPPCMNNVANKIVFSIAISHQTKLTTQTIYVVIFLK